jgi:hypothetical protein
MVPLILKREEIGTPRKRFLAVLKKSHICKSPTLSFIQLDAPWRIYQKTTLLSLLVIS